MKVSVKYSGPGTTAETWFEAITKRMYEGVADAIEEGAQRGEKITKHNIETRGTMKSGKRGRVETGKMRDAVNSKTVSRSKKRVTSEFGWIDEYQDYFGLQEDGFNHVGGVTVDGMYAISDAADEVFQDIESDIDKAIRDA